VVICHFPFTRNCASGKSWTHIEADDTGAALTYAALFGKLTGTLMCIKSATELDVLGSRVDIGIKVLTGESKGIWRLHSCPGGPTISEVRHGTQTFKVEPRYLRLQLEGNSSLTAYIRNTFHANIQLRKVGDIVISLSGRWQVPMEKLDLFEGGRCRNSS